MRFVCVEVTRGKKVSGECTTRVATAGGEQCGKLRNVGESIIDEKWVKVTRARGLKCQSD